MPKAGLSLSKNQLLFFKYGRPLAIRGHLGPERTAGRLMLLGDGFCAALGVFVQGGLSVQSPPLPPRSFGIYDLAPVSTPKYFAQRTYTENIPE
jgi:hypothetical protein